jgi:hypothetical protein
MKEMKNNFNFEGKGSNQMTQRSSKSNYLSESEIYSFYARTAYWKEEKMKKLQKIRKQEKNKKEN